MLGTINSIKVGRIEHPDVFQPFIEWQGWKKELELVNFQLISEIMCFIEQHETVKKQIEIGAELQAKVNMDKSVIWLQYNRITGWIVV